jgi:hypothetical protein
MLCHSLGPQLMKLLGVPAHCLSFELRVAAGEIVTVQCEYHPVDKDGNAAAIGTLLGDYELVRREVSPFEQPASVIGFDAWMRERTGLAHAEYMAGHAAGGIAYT